MSPSSAEAHHTYNPFVRDTASLYGDSGTISLPSDSAAAFMLNIYGTEVLGSVFKLAFSGLDKDTLVTIVPPVLFVLDGPPATAHPPRGVPGTIRAYTAEDWPRARDWVRILIADALADQPDARFERSLVQVARSDSDFSVRQHSLSALAHFHGNSVYRFLARFVTDTVAFGLPQRFALDTAIAALGRNG